MARAAIVTFLPCQVSIRDKIRCFNWRIEVLLVLVVFLCLASLYQHSLIPTLYRRPGKHKLKGSFHGDRSVVDSLPVIHTHSTRPTELSVTEEHEGHEYILERFRQDTHDVRVDGDTVVNKEDGPLCNINTSYNFVESGTYIRDSFNELRTVRDISCKRLFERNKLEISYAFLQMETIRRKSISSLRYINMTRRCDEFRKQRGYFSSAFTKLEQDFPIAYSIVAYKHVEQIERLLRAIYRPQNYYCIHMDLKSSRINSAAIRAIAACFPNVVVSSSSVSVVWGTYSVLEAELICMEELWRFKTWKYFINLTGQELPLKTNLELVSILKALKGANIVGGSRNRVKYLNYKRYEDTDIPPHGIRVVKGPVHVLVNRHFVDFALHDNRSLDFLEWLKYTGVPDESFFSSLNYNPHLGIPGSFLGDAEEYPEKPLISRFKNWRYPNGDWNRPCSGIYIHDICIFGISDLHRLQDTLGLFVNKVLLNFQYFTFECLEEMILNRTRDQYLNGQPIDVSVYEHLDQVKLQLVNH